ncbi:MFS transporter [Fluviispira vulneris]|uniref:MFS transporter n=1 Tax=Fluviispira vulneris TaxID=2763012 RepID=UPI001C978554|nr:MFS transporter [Fluviispira vulneris]
MGLRIHSTAINFLHKNNFYIVSLIFRVYYIIFSISYPLFAIANNLPLVVLNLYSITSLVSLFFLICSYRLYHFSIQYIKYIAIIISIINLLFYVFNFYHSIPFCFVFAIIMGLSSSSIEVASLSYATNTSDKSTLKNQLMMLNFLKILGISLGFFIGCLVTSSHKSKEISNIAIYFMAFTSILLSFFIDTAKRNEEKVRFSLMQFFKNKNFKHLNLCIVLFILDLTVFSFWYTTIPPALKSNGFDVSIIGIFLAIEAFCHAFSQKLWLKFSYYIGEKVTFFTSLFSHIFILIVILLSNSRSVMEILILFILLGISNSGTYINSAALFYSRNYDINKFQLISLHLIASSVGKFLGPFIAIFYLK